MSKLTNYTSEKRKSQNNSQKYNLQNNNSQNIVNEKIQDIKLFGETKNDNNSKKYLIEVNNVKKIKGEEDMEVQRVLVGGIILIKESIGLKICGQFNKRQNTHIKKKTFSHKILCEKKEEGIGLLYITIYDILGDYIYDDYYKSLNNKELCSVIQINLYNLIKHKLPWIINYSKDVIKYYYSVYTNKIKIKLNYILDDGVHEISTEEKNSENSKGGLFLNGLIEILDYYDYNSSKYENMGILCKVLSPSGNPKNRKWIQIDIGISCSGKRLHKENVKDSIPRLLKEEINIKLHKDIIDKSCKLYPFGNKLFYGGLKSGNGVEGTQINILEVIYDDQIELLDEEINYDFCKCLERLKIINDFNSKQ